MLTTLRPLLQTRVGNLFTLPAPTEIPFSLLLPALPTPNLASFQGCSSAPSSPSLILKRSSRLMKKSRALETEGVGFKSLLPHILAWASAGLTVPGCPHLQPVFTACLPDLVTASRPRHDGWNRLALRRSSAKEYGTQGFPSTTQDSPVSPSLPVSFSVLRSSTPC